jgi:hypothetical protein
MRRHKFQIVSLGCLLAILAIWVLRSAQDTGDEVRYRQMVHASVWGSRFESAEAQLPGSLVRLFHITNIKTRYIGEYKARQEALLASRYLTNALITITNLPPHSHFTIPPPIPISEKAAGIFAERQYEASAALGVERRLRMLLRGVDSWSFYMASNQAVVTCRTSDVARIRRAIQGP